MDALSLPLFDELSPPAEPQSPAMERAPLRPLYYLENFRVALESLRVRYATLLSPDEAALIETFLRLPQSAQCLFTRLAMRKGPHFRRSTLQYPEIPGCAQALNVLAQQRLVDPDPVVDAASLPEVLNQAELRWILGSATARGRTTVSRDQLALPMESAAGESRPLSRWHAALTNRFVKLSVETVVRRLQWLFFGNDHQDWTELVLTDLGAVLYEVVPLDAHSCAFRNREEIEHFYRLNECRARLGAKERAVSVCETAHRPDAACPWLQDRFTRLQLQLGERLECENEPDLAIALYQGTGCIEGQVQAVRLQERLGRHEAARRDALAAQAQRCTESQCVILDRVLLRMKRRLDRQVVPHRLPTPAHRLELTLPRPDAQRIERVVAAELSTPVAPAFYVENGLITSLFGLLCWQALFAPVPGAFFHAFQTGPADLHTAEFRARRGELFERLLGLLDAGEHEAEIWRNYREKSGTWTQFVRWRRVKPQLLTHALHCIPAAHLKRCFERLLENLRDNTAGLPDLIQFWPEERRYRMIEVKAPGDRLQDNQRRWMAFFAANDMPAAVCHVSWCDEAQRAAGG
jgi:VRR-NUC domain